MDNGNFLVANDFRKECKLYEMHCEFSQTIHTSTQIHTLNMVQFVFEDGFDHITIEVLIDSSYVVCVFFAIKFISFDCCVIKFDDN